MKAISLWQPWASLVAFGEKRWETRGRLTHFRGKLAIAATASAPKRARLFEEFLLVRQALAKHMSPLKVVQHLRQTRGHILAVVDVVDCIPTGEWTRQYCSRGAKFPHPTFAESKQEIAFGDYGPGRFAWKLENIKRLNVPVPCLGGQFLWTVKGHTLDMLNTELALSI
jgi:hypothetical protein